MTEPAAARRLTGDDIAAAWAKASPKMRKLVGELEDSHPGAERELLLCILAISLRSLAESSGYAPEVAELCNEIWAHDPRFRWRLVDVGN